MDLDELRSAQSRERQASQLQHLRDGFYEEAASFIRGLRTERERAAASSDYSFPYDDPEVQRLTNEIQTAEEVVESLYERRVGKVVKMASFDAAGMAVDAEGLTAEETDLFETLVGDIEANRARVLDALAGTAGDEPSSAEASEPDGHEPSSAEASGTAGDATPDAADQRAASGESPTPPTEEEPVHIGSEPTTESPVSTADDDPPAAARPPEEESAPEPVPASGDDRQGAATDAAADTPDHGSGADADAPDSESDADLGRDAPGDADARSGRPTGNDGAPDSSVGAPDDSGTGTGGESGDAMDAASAMGTAGSDRGSGDAPGRSGDVPGSVPDGSPPFDERLESSATASTAPGSTADASAPTGPGTDGGGPSGGSEPPEPGLSDESEPPAASEPSTGASEPSTGASESSDAAADPGEPAGTLVRVTANVGEIFGVDGRAYDLAAGDVVVLPADNAAPLVEDGSAERLETAISFAGEPSDRS
ncbi:MAG: hypothetical protein ABEJ05_04370 [Haloglomus sp.]